MEFPEELVHKQYHHAGHPTFTYRKGKTYYFRRKIPSDLKDLYTKPLFVQSLRTTSKTVAQRLSMALSARLEEQWLSMRIQRIETPAAHLLTENSKYKSDVMDISEALDCYLRVKGEGRSKTFYTHANRQVKYVIDCLGCRSLDLYKTSDAAKFRDWLYEKQLSQASVSRTFSGIKAIFSLCINEYGLEMKNPFAGVYLGQPEQGLKRKSVSIEQIKSIGTQCCLLGDELRMMLGLIIDTGMRLSEAAGLKVSDICLDQPTPHILIRPNDARGLKTLNSERIVPLVGYSLASAEVIKTKTKDGYCFPRYAGDGYCNANSASAALNKWLKNNGATDIVVHGFRHAFRDRLRAAGAQVDLIDQLGGWSKDSVGVGYGAGYSLEQAYEFMREIEVS
jgi:integrase